MFQQPNFANYLSFGRAVAVSEWQGFSLRHFQIYFCVF